MIFLQEGREQDRAMRKLTERLKRLEKTLQPGELRFRLMGFATEEDYERFLEEAEADGDRRPVRAYIGVDLEQV